MSSVDVPGDGTTPGDRDLQAEVDALAARITALSDEVAELKEARANSERLFDVKALAARWGVSVRTVHNVVAEGYIEPTYVMTALRFTWAAIEKYEHGNSGWDKRRRTHRAVIRKKRIYNPDTGRMEKPAS
jgi:hypothetical protein